MTDRWEVPIPPTHVKPMGFFNASPTDLQTSVGVRARPYVPLDGYYRRVRSHRPTHHNGKAPGPGGSGGGEYAAFLAYEKTQTDGQDIISDYMSLNNAQSTIVLNDFTTAQKTGTGFNMVDDEVGFYAFEQAAISAPPGGAVIDYMNTALPSILGQKDWATYKPKWASIGSTNQNTIGENYLKSRLTKTMSASDLKNAISAAATAEQAVVFEDLVLGAGAAAIVGLAAYMYLK